jgi:hypothetical protein
MAIDWRPIDMRKRQNRTVAMCVVLFPGIMLFLSARTFGAKPNATQGKKPSANQPEQTLKTPQVQSRPATPGPSSFRPDMSFAQAVDILRYSTKPPLNIAVLWKDLEENADIYRDTPIGIEGLSGVSLRMHLKLLLMGVSAGSPAEIGYTVDEGVIIIATRESLPVKMKARVYDVTDLVAPPANYFFFPSPGMPFGIPMGGFGGFGPGAGFGMGFQGAASGMFPGGSYGYGNGLTGLIQNQYGNTGNSYRNSPSRPTR